jgi:predicted nucleic acid-binding Zn ribbon protein
MPWQPLPEDRSPERRQAGDVDPPAPVGQSLDRLLRHLGAPAARTVRSVFDDWAEVVGEGIAAHASPVSLRRGRLVVGVPDSAWATQLRFLEPQLLARLAEAFGPDEVSAIDVRVRPRA